MFFSRAVVGAFLAGLTVVNAAPHLLNRRATGLSVELSEAGPTEVKATVKNTGDEVMHLFTGGTVLDAMPVKKLNVYKDGELATFTGIVATHAFNGLPEEEFVTLQPGETAESIINLASVWDLEGGDYQIQSIDAIAFADSDSTSLDGVYEYESNILNMNITPEEIAKVAPAIAPLDKRTSVQCSSSANNNALRTALNNAVRFASNGASAAASGSAAKFQEYFRTTSASTRNNVAARFRAIASESRSTTGGATTYYCQDPQNICRGSIIAYCQPARNLIANCPTFYRLPAVSRGRGDQSQASTVIHEMTHAPGVFAPSTQDFAYGYSASTSLSAQQALNNADNYALYADCVTLGC